MTTCSQDVDPRSTREARRCRSQRFQIQRMSKRPLSGVVPYFLRGRRVFLNDPEKIILLRIQWSEAETNSFHQAFRTISRRSLSKKDEKSLESMGIRRPKKCGSLETILERQGNQRTFETLHSMNLPRLSMSYSLKTTTCQGLVRLRIPSISVLGEIERWRDSMAGTVGTARGRGDASTQVRRYACVLETCYTQYLSQGVLSSFPYC